MNCPDCETEMLPIYAYPHTIPEVIPFAAAHDVPYRGPACVADVYETNWIGIDLYICPKCGRVQGETFIDEMRQK